MGAEASRFRALEFGALRQGFRGSFNGVYRSYNKGFQKGLGFGV